MSLSQKPWFEYLDSINVPSRDDGKQFVVTDRRDQIRLSLQDTMYKPLFDEGLILVFQHEDYIEGESTLLLSSHIDSLYEKHFHTREQDQWLGTFDNSITNALLVELMCNELLPPQILVAFTGDEEDEGRGALQVMEQLRYRKPLWETLEAVITTDITAEGFGTHSFVLENYFVRETPLHKKQAAVFESEEEFRMCLEQILEEAYFFLSEEAGDYFFVHHEEAGPDESWEYDEWDLNCFSFCFPCAAHESLRLEEVPVWMHHDHGIWMEHEAIERGREGLIQLCRGLLQRFSRT